MSFPGKNQASSSISRDGMVTFEKKMCFFYVVIPPEDQALSQDVSKVVTSSKELAEVLKRNPHARFQSGNTAQDAMRKALEKKEQSTQDTESILAPPPRKRMARSSLSTPLEGCCSTPPTPPPKTDELLTMGREIITKQNDLVLERIRQNARILCTDCEFPTILQEGCKLNALHLAAKSNNSVVMKHVLNFVSSVSFMRRIYPIQTEERLKLCSKHLVGCYLNTPDKMLHDTPLHFACKFNALECVELLLSHPFCDASLKNSEEMTAFEVIGERSETHGTIPSAIKDLFLQRFIVPIWRDVSVEGDPPVLGEVSFIPDVGQAIPPPLLQDKFPDFSLSLLKPCKSALLPRMPRKSNVKVFASQPPSWKIMAFAGPIGKDRAEEFRKVMKRSRLFLYQNMCTSPDTSLNISAHHVSPTNTTPPSTPPPSSQFLLSPLNSPLSIRALFKSPPVNYSPLKTDMAIRVQNVKNGLERIASEYAREMGIPWSEYWQILDTFCDLTSPKGLSLLEKYIRSVSETDKKENKCKDEPVSSALEVVIDQLSKIRLTNEDLSSPGQPVGKVGVCTNSVCRMEPHFCNCENVVPSVPYFCDDENRIFRNTRSYDDGNAQMNSKVPCSEASQPSLDIWNVHRSSVSTSGSLEVSYNNNLTESEVDWRVSEDEGFETASSSPIDNELFQDCLSDSSIFLCGSTPGKLDYQIFQILKDTNENIDSNQHPSLFQWLNSMYAVGDPLTFIGPGATGHEKPKCLWKPDFTSTPDREANKNAKKMDFSF